jgi:hypothetical protein
MLTAGYTDVDVSLIGGVTRNISARASSMLGLPLWLQGPVVTSSSSRPVSAVHDVGFGDSSALHPIFEARFYPATNDVEVGVSVENTWASYTASKGMRDLTYSIDVNQGQAISTDEFTHPSFKHIGLSRWVKWFWLDRSGAINIEKAISATLRLPSGKLRHDLTCPISPEHRSQWAADKTSWQYDGIGNYG